MSKGAWWLYCEAFEIERQVEALANMSTPEKRVWLERADRLEDEQFLQVLEDFEKRDAIIETLRDIWVEEPSLR